MQIVSASTYLTIDERKRLIQKNDVKALSLIALHWVIIFAAMLVPYYYFQWYTILISLVILGGQQLSCAILMHDASHRSLFTRSALNDWMGQWLGAYPIFNNMLRYRDYHLEHHLYTGLKEDPDLLLTRGYPTSKRSMIRKIFRDLTGQTGIKAMIGLMMIHLGLLEYNLGGKLIKTPKEERTWRNISQAFRKNLLGPISFHLLFVFILSIMASGWIYLLWIVSYMTTFQFCLRIRSMAEHSMVEDTTDPLKNTRTTKANLLERLLFAPYYVNYHVEHHMLMNVPPYNLPRMHRLLKERGFYEHGIYETNYLNIIRKTSSQ